MEEVPVKKKNQPRPARQKMLQRGTKDPAKNLFVRMQQTEEGRKLWKLWTDKRFAPGVRMGRPRGAVTGYSGSQYREQKAKAKAEAKEIVALMEKKGFEIPKTEFAKEAIEVAVEIMRTDAMHPKDKLAAARTVLEWTLSKPVAVSEVSVKRAEDFLASVLVAEEKAKELE